MTRPYLRRTGQSLTTKDLFAKATDDLAASSHSGHLQSDQQSQRETDSRLKFQSFQKNEQLIHQRKNESISQANLKLQRIQYGQNFENQIKLKAEADVENQALDEREKKQYIKKLFSL